MGWAQDARRLMQAQQLKSLEEWQAWCKEGKRPPNVPSNPHKTYRCAATGRLY